MKAFFDTNVYINTFFKPTLPKDQFIQFFQIYEVMVCPIVRHELLLGTIHEKTRKELGRFFDQCEILEAPDQVQWDQATHLMKKLKWKENRQQNDVLIALTAQKTNAVLITYDRHFLTLKDHLGFQLVLLSE